MVSDGANPISRNRERFVAVGKIILRGNLFKTGSGNSNGENKLQGFYGFRIGNNSTDPESRGGYVIRFQNATDNAATSVGLDPTASVFKDVNTNSGGGSIGSLITSTLEGGDFTDDGNEVQVVADGVTNGNGGLSCGQNALFTRIIHSTTRSSNSH